MIQCDEDMGGQKTHWKPVFFYVPPRIGVKMTGFDPRKSRWYPPQKKKNNMAMENPPFEDVFPTEHGDVPLC